MLCADVERECPHCRAKDHQVVPDVRTRRQTMSLKVQCTNGGSCSWRGELVDYTSHTTEKCPSRSVQCRYGCGLYYSLSDVAVHEEEECTKRPYDVIVGHYKRLMKDLEERHSQEVQSLEDGHSQAMHTFESKTKDLEEKHIQQVRLLQDGHSQEVHRLSQRVLSVESKMREQESKLVKCRKKLVNLENKQTTYSKWIIWD